MTPYQGIFKRVEKKYLLDREQYRALTRRLAPHLIPDRYPVSTIGSLYYDTPNHALIRASLEKPVYKEKLRLRSYGIPSSDTVVFLEIKKKYRGVVYKRRVGLTHAQAQRWMEGNSAPVPGDNPQIAHEIEWFRQFYPGLRPAMLLSYERTAWQGRDSSDLRVTFDENIRWREEQTALDRGFWGHSLLPAGSVLMELKIPGAMPVWLAEILGELRIYSTSYSKYGGAYWAARQGGIICA